MAACGQAVSDNCDDCVQVVRETKTVQVPCTVNTYRKYSVNVPRQVMQQVPRTVTYTEYENRDKKVPFTVNRSERRIRVDKEQYQVPVTKYYKRTTMETRERQVPVTYYVDIPETKYRTVMEKVPVQRSKIQYEERLKTVYDTQIRQRCVPETRMVRKTLPVYNVVAKDPKPCPLSGATEFGAVNGYRQVTEDGDRKSNNNEVGYTGVDTNMGGQISHPQYKSASAIDTSANQVAYSLAEIKMDGQISYPQYTGMRAVGTMNQISFPAAPNQVAYTPADTRRDGQISYPRYAGVRSVANSNQIAFAGAANQGAYTATGTKLNGQIPYPQYSGMRPVGTSNQISYTAAERKMDGQTSYPKYTSAYGGRSSARNLNSGIKYLD